MSSDYGSDIDSDVADVVDEIVSSQQAPPSSAQIPRPALKPLHTNTAPTPPSSHDKSDGITLQQWHQAASTPPSSYNGSPVKAPQLPASSQQWWVRDGSTPPPSFDDEPYRMTFGKHEGKTLAEIPDSYVRWLIRNPIPSRPVEFTDALKEWEDEKAGRRTASSQPQSQASQMSMSSQTQATPSSQVYQAPPPSSQPVLSSSHVSRYTNPPSPSRSPSPGLVAQQPPPSSQPTAPQKSPDAPLYVLPFGEYKGKTLLEVPEDYLYYLGASEDKLATLPGLAEALGLMQKDLPPVAMEPMAPSQTSSQTLPPPSSEPPASSQISMASQSQQTQPPPSTAPSHYSLCKDDMPNSSQPPAPQLSASQPAPQPPSSQPPPRKQPYRFDFGKHEGKTIAEVPPDYMAFLKSKGFTETNETLAAGVAEYERHHPPIGTPRKGEYRFTFGKHEGKTVAEVPSQYIWWLKTQTSIPKDKT
ncbi:uncharacterized protein J4E87_010466 [Alternaria ethzedia]|uniref:uncharacterized protein n=1 Tax=Alternaria ethzedia TaxID=181014 RepID=UPI0020C1BFF2|nr:uncharacterized protein J4E87_010466 [Alternaria ethzedia]KAI4611616.1 hypothetical protein J4E87_010466 [Alternaria ethzedia]